MSGRQAVQIGFAVVGTVVGAYFQNPQLGLAIGSIVGGLVANAAFPLDPIVNRQENLSDVSITSAALGVTRPKIYGRWPVGGNVIWAYPKITIERTTEQSTSGGKGGILGGQKAINISTEYRIHMLLALCRGPVSRITKIFFDATLIYDESQPQGWEVYRGLPDGDPDVSTADLDTSPDSIIYDKPGESLRKFVLFRGTETQEPWAFAESLDDPADMETTLEGKLPGYRGTAVVGISLDLGPTGRVPNIRCEVATSDPSTVRPILLYYNFTTAQLWEVGATGTLETSETAGGARAILIDDYTGETLRGLPLGGTTADLTGTLADNRTPVALTRCQGIGGVETFAVQHADSTITVLPDRAGIDPRTEGEIEALTTLGAGSIAARPSGTSENYLQTLAYTLPDINSIGQCDTDLFEADNFLRVAVSADPTVIVWNQTEAAFYVSCQGANVVEKINGLVSLVIQDTIAVGARPTALIVDANDDCWVACKDAGTVYRFTSSGDVTSPITVGASPDSLSNASDDFIWVANTGASTVSRIDPVALTVETFDVPAPPTQVLGAATDDGKCWVVSSVARSVYLLDPSDGTYITTQVPRNPGAITLDGGGNLWVASATARQVVRIDNAGNLLQQEVASGLACVVRDVCIEAGVPLEWIDVSGLDSTPVNYPIFGIASASRALDDLALAYQFIGIENGNGLKFFFKGGVPVATLADLDCIPGEDGQTILVERAYQQEVPTDITVVYRDPERHFHDNEQHLQIPYPPDSGRVYEVANVAVGFEDAQIARNLAEVLLYEPRFARFALRWRLPAIGQLFEPGDIVEITQGTDVYHAQLTNVTIGQDGTVDCKAVRQRSYLYEDFASTPGDALGATGVIAQPAVATLSILEPPALPGDDTTPYFLPVYRRGVGGTFLPTAVLYESVDAGVTYAAKTQLSIQAAAGVVASPTPTAETNDFDDLTVITVQVDPGVTLVSATDTELASGSNRCMIGSECIQYGVATLVSTSIYELTHLLRGRRGTEQHVGTHGSNELFVLLNIGLLATAQDFPTVSIGQTRYYKLVPNGQTLANVTAIPYTLLGTNIKPWAPPIVELIRTDATNVFTVSWYHRSRLQGDLVNFGSIMYDPDDLQSYEIIIYSDDLYSTVVNTYTTATFADANSLRTYDYAGLLQIADFGTLQSGLSLGIRQRVLGIQGYESRISNLVPFTLPYEETFENVTVVLSETTEDFEA